MKNVTVFLGIILATNLVTSVWSVPAGGGSQINTGEITISNDLLRNLLPNIKNPRLLTIQDLRDEIERENFSRFGHSFIVKGDFNRDGQTDYAVAGKFDSNDEHSATFILVLTIAREKPKVLYYRRLYVDRFVLHQIEKCIGRFGGVGLTFTMASDDVSVLAWNGRMFNLVNGCPREN